MSSRNFDQEEVLTHKGPLHHGGNNFTIIFIVNNTCKENARKQIATQNSAIRTTHNEHERMEDPRKLDGLTEFSKNVIERRNPVLSDNTSRYSAQFLDE